MKTIRPCIPAFILAVTLLASCSPKVGTQISRSLPPMDETSPVTVFALEQQVPADAEFIGTVSIGDTGFTTKCNYATLLDIAIERTRQAGGNAFNITRHDYPSVVSSCHRIEGQILFIQEKTVAEVERPVAKAADDTGGSGITPLPKWEYAQETMGSNQDYGNVVYDDIYYDDEPGYTSYNAPIKASKVRFSIDAGWTFRTAQADESMSYADRELYRKMRSGFLVSADLHGFVEANWGLGVRFDGRFYSASQDRYDYKVNTLYFAPSLIYREYNRRGNAWVCDLSVGYLHYKEKFPVSGFSKGGFGSTVGIGYDIRMGGNSFFGFKLSVFSGFVMFKDIYGDNYRNDMSAIELSAGFRF